MTEFQRQVGVVDFVDALVARSQNSELILKQVGEARKALDAIETSVLSETNLPISFASTVLQASIESNKPEAMRFAICLAAHLNENKPLAEFLPIHQEFRDLDLSWLSNSKPDILKFLEPPTEFPNSVLVYQAPIVALGDAHPLVLEEKKKIRTDQVVYEPTITLDDAMEMLPVVSELFGGTNKLWQDHEGVAHLSLKNICSIFEKTNPTGVEEKDTLAIYQGINGEAGLLNKFFELNPKYSSENFVKIPRKKDKFFTRQMAIDFVIFCVETLNIGESRIKLRVKSGFPKPVVLADKIIDEKLETPLKDDMIREWSEEEIRTYFETEPGLDLLSKARDKDEISSKLVLINKNFPAARFILDENVKHFYWRPGRDNHLRTLRENLTMMISTNGRQLSTEEQLDFFNNNITTLWKVVFDQVPGASVDGYIGLYLSRDEFINGLYLMNELSKVKELNTSTLAVIQAREDIKPKMPVSMAKKVKEKSK